MFINVRPSVNTSYVVTDDAGCLIDLFNVAIGDIFQDPGLEQTNFRIAPIPDPDVLFLKITRLQTNYNLRIYDLNGKAVLHKTTDDLNSRLDVQAFANGFYLLLVSDDRGKIIYHMVFVKH